MVATSRADRDNRIEGESIGGGTFVRARGINLDALNVGQIAKI